MCRIDQLKLAVGGPTWPALQAPRLPRPGCAAGRGCTRSLVEQLIGIFWNNKRSSSLYNYSRKVCWAVNIDYTSNYSASTVYDNQRHVHNLEDNHAGKTMKSELTSLYCFRLCFLLSTTSFFFSSSTGSSSSFTSTTFCRQITPPMSTTKMKISKTSFSKQWET